MSDLRELLGQHTGVRIFNGSVYCHPCGELLYDPLEGFCGGPLIQRGGEMIGEAAHAFHLNVLLSDLFAQAWDEGRRIGLTQADYEYGHRLTMPNLTNPYRQEANHG